MPLSNALSPGDVVVIHGLVSKPEHNFCAALIIDKAAPEGRMAVQLLHRNMRRLPPPKHRPVSGFWNCIEATPPSAAGSPLSEAAGLTATPELDEQVGTALKFNRSTGRLKEVMPGGGVYNMVRDNVEDMVATPPSRKRVESLFEAWTEVRADIEEEEDLPKLDSHMRETLRILHDYIRILNPKEHIAAKESPNALKIQ